MTLTITEDVKAQMITLLAEETVWTPNGPAKHSISESHALPISDRSKANAIARLTEGKHCNE